MDMSLILYQLSFNYPFHYHTTLIINPYLSCMKEFLYPSLNPWYAMDMSGISTRTLLYDGKVVTANRCLKESICSDCITSTYLIGMNNTFAFLDKYVDPNSQDFDWFDWNLRSIPVTDLLYVTLLYLHPCKHCQRYHHLSSSPMASVTKPDKIPTWSKRPSKWLFWQWSAAKKQKHRCVPAGKTSRHQQEPSHLCLSRIERRRLFRLFLFCTVSTVVKAGLKSHYSWQMLCVQKTLSSVDVSALSATSCKWEVPQQLICWRCLGAHILGNNFTKSRVSFEQLSRA